MVSSVKTVADGGEYSPPLTTLAAVVRLTGNDGLLRPGGAHGERAAGAKPALTKSWVSPRSRA
ncbi:MAG: hypothetical protein OXE42_16515 [Gammaproteobacteria bacterium]|nr:hypothetical protein [Gammaproteobacteria bacterium]